MITSAEMEHLTERLELADQLHFGRATMLEPQDLPGRYGRTIRAVDHLLAVMGCEAVLAGGWAVWWHGFEGRMTQDVDIVLPADRIEEFLRVAAVAGFDILPQPEGRWPKVMHKQTQTKVDILPEGARPGTAKKLAPTAIPHPSKLGAAGTSLRYISLPTLIELKLAAGRARDEADIVELVRANAGETDRIRQHLVGVHADYVQTFDRLVDSAREQQDH